MRLVIALATAAALPALAGAAQLPAAAAGPVSTHPLAPGEVLLEVNAIGLATSPADVATFNLMVTCHGATKAEARRESEQQIQRVRAAARAVGARDEDVQVTTAAAARDFESEVVEDLVGFEAAQPDPAPAERHVVRSAVEIRLRDVERVADLRERLEAIGIEMASGPTYSLSDDRAARARARAEAIATARADAEAYAAGLGMRVARIVRVSERIGMEALTLFAMNPTLSRRMQAMGTSQRPDVETQIVIGVDFALAPQ